MRYASLLLLILFPVYLFGQDRGMSVVPLHDANVSIPKYHALVIGVDKYSEWPSLRYAKSDAEQVGRVLREKYGFSDIRTLYDKQATLDNINHELYQLIDELTSNDLISTPVTNPIGCSIKWEGRDSHWMPPEACDLI